MTQSTDKRADEVQTIASHARLIADVLDSFPAGVEPPTHHDIAAYLTKPRLSWLLFSGADNQKNRAAAIVKAFGGTWDKKETGDLFAFKSERGGVELDVTVERESVCERIVTGQREVTVTEVVESREVTVTEDIVEWRCAPLLSEAAS